MSSPELRIGHVLRDGWLWALVAGVLAFFRRPLLGQTFFFRDIYRLFVPEKLFMVRAFREGSFPLWNPYLHGGLPYASDPANYFFHPANVLYAFCDPVTAFNLTLVLNFVALAVVTHLLARSLGMCGAAAFIAGTCATLSGFALSAANLVPLLLALPCFPLSALALHRLVVERRNRWLVVSALAGALPLLSGAAEMTILIGISSLAWVFLTEGAMPPAARMRALAASWLMSFALAAVLLLPAGEMIAESARSGKQPYEVFAAWSIAPQRLPELVVPYFFGFGDLVDSQWYWGRAHEDKKFPYTVSIHCGLLTLLLAAAARPTERLPRRLLLVLVLFVVGSTVIALGRNLPGFELLHRYTPVIGKFRYPTKALAIGMLPMALLAAAGADRLLRERSLRSLAPFAAASVASLATLPVAFNDGLLHRLELFFFNTAGFAGQDATLRSSLMVVTLCCAGLTLALFIHARRGGTVPRAIGCALVFVSLAFAGDRVNAYAQRSLYAPQQYAPLVSKVVGDGHLYRPDVPLGVEVEIPGAKDTEATRWHLEVFDHYSSPLAGIATIFHEDFDGLAPKSVMTMNYVLDRLAWPARVQLLRAAGVSGILTEEQFDAKGIDHVATLPTEARVPMQLYAVRGAQAARVTCASISDADPDNALRALLRREIAPPAVAITAPGPRRTSGPCEASLIARTTSVNGSRQLVRVSRPGFLVVAQTFYPGWTATVDGRDAPLLRADYAFTAVAVPQGDHVVELRYRPRRLFAGALISAIALATLLVCARFDALRLHELGRAMQT